MAWTREKLLFTETSLVFEPGLEGGEDAPVVSFKKILDDIFDEEDEENAKPAA